MGKFFKLWFLTVRAISTLNEVMIFPFVWLARPLAKISLKSKIFTLLFSITGAISCIAILMAVNIDRTNKSITAIVKRQIDFELLLGEINSASHQLEHLMIASSVNDKVDKDKVAEIESVFAIFSNLMENADDQDIKLFRKEYLVYESEVKKVLAAFKEKTPKEAIKFGQEAIPKAYGNMKTMIDDKMIERGKTVTGILKSADDVCRICLIFLVFFFVFSVSVGWRVVQEVVLPILVSSKKLEDSADAVGVFANSTKDKAEISKINNTHVVKAINTTVECMSNLEKIAEQNFERIGNSTTVADNSSKSAMICEKTISELQASIEEIWEMNNIFRNEVGNIQARMDETVATVSEIANRTKIINDIVFQTRLLSFNASVEAARAGETGKGFSVVAEEIGKLARVSGEAAMDIEKLVQESLVRTKSTTTDIKTKMTHLTEVVGKSVNEGKVLGNDSKKALNTVMVSFDELKRQLNDIKMAALGQADSIKQVDGSMQRLVTLSDEASEFSKDVSLASSNLNEHSDELFSVICHINSRLIGGDPKNYKKEKSNAA